MNTSSIVIGALLRKPARTALTMLGVVIAFLLFGLLQGVNSAFSATIERMRLDRIFVEPRFSNPLPLSYRERIREVAGVASLTEIAFLGGYYQDRKNGVLVIATSPEIWLSIRPEFRVPKEQVDATVQTRNGAIVMDWMARQHGWRIGDHFTVRALAGMPALAFVVVGTMKDPDPTARVGFVLANFSYYDETRLTDKGTADRFLVSIDNPLHSARISREIDTLFETSGIQTRTQTEQEMAQSAIARTGDIRFFTHSIIGAAFFTLVILTGNTIMESIAERTSELALLKALGFSNGAVLVLVVSESVAMCVTAALVGLSLAAVTFPLANSYVQTSILPPAVVMLGLAVATCIAVISAAVPAWRALRLRVVDALTVR